MGQPDAVTAVSDTPLLVLHRVSRWYGKQQVLRDVSDPSSRIPRLTVAEGKKAIADGIVTKGMIPKLEESFAAIGEGVRAVHVVGRLERGQLAREVAEPGSVGTVLLP